MRPSLRPRPAALVLALLAAAAPAGAQESGAESEGKTVRFPVTFETSDGFTIHADLYSAADTSAPVAILLHMYRSDRSAWSPLVPALTGAGFTVLAIDQRAHGDSIRKEGEAVRASEVPREDFGELVRAGPRDVRAALRYLEERGMETKQVVLIGASYGCSVALLSAREIEGVDGLVLLSPGTRYFEVDVTDEARAFAEPALFVAAEDDPNAATAARTLAEERPQETTTALRVLAEGGHGTRLLPERPALRERIAAFAKEAVAP